MKWLKVNSRTLGLQDMRNMPDGRALPRALYEKRMLL